MFVPPNNPPTNTRVIKGGAKAGNDDPEQRGGDADEDARPSAALSPSWLGAFTVSAYDEVVSVPFEIAALVDGKEVAAPGGARRGGGADGVDDGIVERRGLGEDEDRGDGEERLPANAGEGKWDEQDRGGGVAGEDEEWEWGREDEQEEGGSADEERRLNLDDDGCQVTVCAAVGRILLGYEAEGGGDDEPPTGEDGVQSVCRSVVVKRQGAAVSGVLELPDRPQVTRVPNLACHY